MCGHYGTAKWPWAPEGAGEWGRGGVGRASAREGVVMGGGVANDDERVGFFAGGYLLQPKAIGCNQLNWFDVEGQGLVVPARRAAFLCACGRLGACGYKRQGSGNEQEELHGGRAWCCWCCVGVLSAGLGACRVPVLHAASHSLYFFLTVGFQRPSRRSLPVLTPCSARGSVCCRVVMCYTVASPHLCIWGGGY